MTLVTDHTGKEIVWGAEGKDTANHVRLITRRAYGFHSPKAALALVLLSCGEPSRVSRALGFV